LGSELSQRSRLSLRWIIASLVLVIAVLASTAAASSPEDSEAPPTATSQPEGTELPQERTALSNTFLLPDGERETRIYQSPVNYRDEEGAWKPIEQGLEGTLSGDVVNGDNSFDLRLPENLSQAPVKVSVGEAWVSERPVALDTDPIALEEGTASYALDSGSAELEFSGLANGLKENIVLTTSAPSTYHFELDASEGVTPTLAEDGSIEFVYEDGETVARMPAPVMYDGAGTAAPAEAITYSLQPEFGGTWKLTVAADPDWLDDPARVTPITIDPSLTIPAPALDCAIVNQSYSENSFCGTSGWPYVGLKASYKSSGADEYWRTLLRFNVASIPPKASISEATIGIYATGKATNTSQVQLYDANKSWENTVSWKNYKVVSGTKSPWTTEGGDYGKWLIPPVSIETAQRGTQAGWWEFKGQNLPWLVQKWATGEIPNEGVLLKLGNEKTRECCITRNLEFASSATSTKPFLSVKYVGPASADSVVSAPTDGTTAAKRFLLTSAWDHSGVEGVYYQYKGPFGWSDIPASQVTNGKNQTVTWPLGVESIDDRESDPLYWNPTVLLGTKSSARFQIRAVLTGSPGASGYTKPIEAELNRTVGGPKDAVAPIGPGQVDLLTGNFTISRSDVSIAGFGGALSFSRSISSAEPSVNPTGVLGPGWQPSGSLEVSDATGWRSLKLESETEVEEEEGETFSFTYNWAELTRADGTTASFDEDEDGNFLAPPEMTGDVLYRNPATGNIEFTAPDGTRTVFSNFATGSNEYLPVSIVMPGGSGNQSQMVYEPVGGKRRLKTIIAPAAPGITCPAESAGSISGCRLLTFTYEPATKWGAPASAGDRLSKISYTAGGFGGATDVAQYGYNTVGRLASSWDPRISPNLKETYAYGAENQLLTLTPPGVQPWTMQYGNLAGETTTIRLLSVKRSSLVPSEPIARTTIAYGVPMSGSGLPNLNPQEAAKWGQEDLATDATAIFPPNEVPSSPPSSYAHAAIYYMDAEGQVSNVATPAGEGSSEFNISTTETDTFGNEVRELTPGNRVRALTCGCDTAAKSKELDTQLTYSADGTKLLDERGPVHPVRLESGLEAGEIQQARSYRSIQYDVGAPEPADGETWPLLPTHETTGALFNGKVLDQQTVRYGYDWTLRQQTEQIVDPEGLKIQTISAYDKESGRPTEVRQPKDEAAAGSGTTRFVYYKKAGASPGPCEKDLYAGLLCKEEPAVQPTGLDLPVTYYAKYSSLGRPEEVVETVVKPSAATRKTIITYDSSGRPKSNEITGGDATQVPKVERTYSTTTGFPVSQQFVCPVGEPSCDKQTTTIGYDALGRAAEYQDADGVTSKATYDLNGNVISVDDGKGSQTIRYDKARGLPVELADSMAGTFTASYDADGQMVQQGLPNGLTATTTFDAAGAQTKLTYTKASSCGSSCTWLNFEVTRSAAGRILSEAGTLGGKSFAYDAASRLTKAQETPPGGGCTTRVYAYDNNSNRTSKTTRAPGVGGVCSESGGTLQAFSYDDADRLFVPGTIYDLFGRVTTLPASAAGGSNLQTSYFSTGMVASQTQGGVTNSFALDASMRQRQRIQAGGVQGIEVFHYSSGSDSPAWTALGETWTRNVMGIGGGLVAVAKSGSGTRLQLANLHGDIVATASTDPAVSQLEMTARTDEFGVPLSGTPQRYGWLGGSVRRTELASGVIQMGARSYVPTIGKFLSPDPIAGGSANAYDYGNADPVNQFDPMGMAPYGYDEDCDPGIVKCQVKLQLWMWSSRGKRMGVRMRWRTNRAGGGINLQSVDIWYWENEPMDIYREGFKLIPPPHYLNNYPGLPAECRGTDPCADNHDARGTFACNGGSQYQILLKIKYFYNEGSGGGEIQFLEAKAQMGCMIR